MSTKPQTVTADGQEVEHKAIPDLSIDAQILCKMLRAVGNGDVVGYDDMTKAIGRDVQKEARHILQSARRVMEREGKVFECVMNVGVKLMDDSAKANLHSGAIDKMRRTAKRTRRKMETTEYCALSDADKTNLNVGLSLLGAFQQALKPKQLKAIESAVAEAHDKLPLARTLELFAK